MYDERNTANKPLRHHFGNPRGKYEPGWAVVSVAFTVYSLLFIIGGVIGEPFLLTVGCLLFFVVIVLAGGPQSNVVRITPPTIAITTAFLAAVVTAALHPEFLDAYYITKSCALLGFFVLYQRLGLVPVGVAGARHYLFAVVVIVISGSLLLGGVVEYHGQQRAQGFFVTPGNLALGTFGLLFFFSQSEESRRFASFLKAAVGIVLIWTLSTGAILAYGVGLTYDAMRQSGKRKTAILGLASIVVMGGILVHGAVGESIPIVDRFSRQMSLVVDEARGIIKGRSLGIGSFSSRYGDDATSGLWRIYHWSRVVAEIRQADIGPRVFGYGSGASLVLVGKLPHNDYLRVLLENGVLGFSLVLYVFWYYVRSVNQNQKYLVVTIAVFAATENIIDNLWFMSLFVGFLVSNEYQRRPDKVRSVLRRINGSDVTKYHC